MGTHTYIHTQSHTYIRTYMQAGGTHATKPTWILTGNLTCTYIHAYAYIHT